MARFRLIIYIFITISITSCISNKDLVYLQNGTSENLPIKVQEDFSKPYRVQTDDILSITIKTIDPKLTEIFSSSASSSNQNNQTSVQNLYFNGYTVDNLGNIRVPVLGEIKVIGSTVDDIRQTIETRLLNQYFKKEAQLFVNVKLAGLRYTINGEIGSPGTNVLYQDKATLMEAIANSGDITMVGDRKQVQVIRKKPYGYETQTLDLTDAKSVQSPFFYLQPNDYIYIKPLPQKSWGTGTTGMQTIGTIITALSLLTTTILLTRNL